MKIIITDHLSTVSLGELYEASLVIALEPGTGTMQVVKHRMGETGTRPIAEFYPIIESEIQQASK